MAKKRIFILGAGLSGLSVAWYLQRKGIDFQVFEKEPGVGGLCRSMQMNDFTFDYCGHLLHFKDRGTFDFVKSLFPEDGLVPHERSAWVYSHGRYSKYPFQANLYGLPSRVVKECLLGLIEASRNGHLKKEKKISFHDWVILHFGKGIAKHFMVPYNAKFWTVSPRSLTCDWLKGIIPTPSLQQTIEGTVEESRAEFGYNARFWYPKKKGIGQLTKVMAESIKSINTDCEVIQIDLFKKELKLSSGRKEKFDCLVSTIPLPELPKIIKGLPKQLNPLFKRLRWNSIFNLNLGIEKKDHSGRHWVYFPEKEFCFFRVGFFHNFSSESAPTDRSSIYTEVSYSREIPIDKNNIARRIKEDLKKAGMLLKDDRIIAEQANDIKYGYPIYDFNYSRTREKILKHLSRNGIVSCGRYGSWRYMSMEDAILEAKDISGSF